MGAGMCRALLPLGRFAVRRAVQVGSAVRSLTLYLSCRLHERRVSLLKNCRVMDANAVRPSCNNCRVMNAGRSALSIRDCHVGYAKRCLPLVSALDNETITVLWVVASGHETAPPDPRDLTGRRGASAAAQGYLSTIVAGKPCKADSRASLRRIRWRSSTDSPSVASRA